MSGAPSKSTFVQFSIRVPAKTHAGLARMAADDGRSLNGMVNVLLRAALDADKQRRAGK